MKAYHDCGKTRTESWKICLNCMENPLFMFSECLGFLKFTNKVVLDNITDDPAGGSSLQAPPR